tara:strand:+ start:62 stop:1138 length:1077 start_codon:yes stop_codon:yes gene_type:complete
MPTNERKVALAKLEAMMALRTMKAFRHDHVAIANFWFRLQLRVLVVTLGSAAYIYYNVLSMKTIYRPLWDWKTRSLDAYLKLTGDASTSVRQSGGSGIRTLTDITLAARNPTLHAFLDALAIYPTCTQSAANFVVMTLEHFIRQKNDLPWACWMGDTEAESHLEIWFPLFDKDKGEDVQWAAWQASATVMSITESDGSTSTIGPNPWFNVFPTTQAAFFEVPIIHEFAHEGNHTDLDVTRFGSLFKNGLNGCVTLIDVTRSPAQLFQDYWVARNLPTPASCNGIGSKAVSDGVSGAMGGAMVGGPAMSAMSSAGFATGYGALVAIGVTVACGVASGIASAKASHEQCNADRETQREDE